MRWANSFKRYNQSSMCTRNDKCYLAPNGNIAWRMLLHCDTDKSVQFGECFCIRVRTVALRSGVAYRGDAPRSSTPRDALRVNRVLHPLALIEQRDHGAVSRGPKGGTSAATVARVAVHPRCYYYAQLRADSASGCQAGGKEREEV